MDYGLCVTKTGKLKQLMSFPFFFVLFDGGSTGLHRLAQIIPVCGKLQH
jgi:hypothetical protein